MVIFLLLWCCESLPICNISIKILSSTANKMRLDLEPVWKTTRRKMLELLKTTAIIDNFSKLTILLKTKW